MKTTLAATVAVLCLALSGFSAPTSSDTASARMRTGIAVHLEADGRADARDRNRTQPAESSGWLKR